MTDLIELITDRYATRDSVAAGYAWLLAARRTDPAEWERINQAIVNRWSVHTLDYIDTRARWIIAANR